MGVINVHITLSLFRLIIIVHRKLCIVNMDVRASVCARDRKRANCMFKYININTHNPNYNRYFENCSFDGSSNVSISSFSMHAELQFMLNLSISRSKHFFLNYKHFFVRLYFISIEISLFFVSLFYCR